MRPYLSVQLHFKLKLELTVGPLSWLRVDSLMLSENKKDFLLNYDRIVTCYSTHK